MFRNFLKSYQDVWKVTTLDVYILEEKKEPFVPSDGSSYLLPPLRRIIRQCSSISCLNYIQPGSFAYNPPIKPENSYKEGTEKKKRKLSCLSLIRHQLGGMVYKIDEKTCFFSLVDSVRQSFKGHYWSSHNIERVMGLKFQFLGEIRVKTPIFWT